MMTHLLTYLLTYFLTYWVSWQTKCENWPAFCEVTLKSIVASFSHRFQCSPIFCIQAHSYNVPEMSSLSSHSTYHLCPHCVTSLPDIRESPILCIYIIFARRLRQPVWVGGWGGAEMTDTKLLSGMLISAVGFYRDSECVHLLYYLREWRSGNGVVRRNRMCVSSHGRRHLAKAYGVKAWCSLLERWCVC